MADHDDALATDPGRLGQPADGSPPVGGPPTVVDWMAAGAIDGFLAAAVWLLAEGGVPVVAAGDDLGAADELAAALDVFGRPPAFLSPFPRSLGASSLEDVLDCLGRPPYELTEDAARSVGVVLVVTVLPDGRRRIVAAHYVRPLEQDGHGHLQRRPPALLAAWDRDADRLDDYAWGISAELGSRIGMAAPAFELARAERAELLVGLAAAGARTPEAVAGAIAAHGLSVRR